MSELADHIGWADQLGRFFYLYRMPQNTLLGSDDVQQSARAGLVKAWSRWDGGGAFRTFAFLRVRGEIIDEIRRSEGYLGSRKGVRLQREVPLGDEYDGGDGGGFARRQEARIAVAELLAKTRLTRREREMVEAFIELGQQKAAGDRLGLTDGRVSQLMAAAVKKMRAAAGLNGE